MFKFINTHTPPLTLMNVNSPNTMIVQMIAIFSPSVWCSSLRVHWFQKKFCMEMWRDPDRFRLSSWVCFWTFFFAAGILKPRGVLLFALLLLCGSTPPRGSWDLGGKVLVGFLGCADCDVLKSSGVTCCARAAAAVAVTRAQRICMRCISSCGGTQ